MSTYGPVRAIAVATGTGDVDPDTAGNEELRGPLIYHGFAFRESAGTPAVATIIIRDGRDSSAKIIDVIELAANESAREYYERGVHVSSGLYIDRVAGETEGSVRIS